MDQRGIRTSQRASRSCTECSRRKIKCDKRIPCKSCIQRNVAHECARPIVRVGGKLTVASDSPPASSHQGTDGSVENVAELLKERSALRSQIAQLECALSLVRPGVRTAMSTTRATSSECNDQLDDLQPGISQYDLGTRFAESHPSRTKDNATFRHLWDLPIEPVLAMLPDRQTSHRLVKWSLANLGWIPCAVRADEFLQQHKEFWDMLSSRLAIVQRQRTWLAIYFALLAISLIYMNHDEVPSADQLPSLPFGTQANSSSHLGTAEMWYEAAIMELKRSDALDHALLETVQAAMILTLCHGIFGENYREQLLNGLAIQAARSMSMHHLGTEEAHPKWLESRPEWSTPAGRELGRRLWWSLVACDWLGSWSRPPSISPATFSVRLPGNSPTDSELLPTYYANTVGALPSPAQYLNIVARLAYTFYVYIAANSHRTIAKLSRALEEIEIIRKALPLCLSEHFPANADDELWESQHAWITFQRYLISHVIHFMQLSIARTLLLSGEDDCESHRSIAVRAANKILEHAQEIVPRMYRIVWVVPAATVAAGIFVSLDRLVYATTKYPSVEIARTSGMILHALQTLRHYSDVTMRTEEGCQIIERLSEMLTYWTPPSNSKYGDAARSALAQAAEDMSPNLMQQVAGLDGFDLEFDMFNLNYDHTAPMWTTSALGFDGFVEHDSASHTYSLDDQSIWK